MLTVLNNDTGSLLVLEPIRVGDQLVDDSWPHPRQVTYVAGSIERGNQHAYCRGTPAFPMDAVVSYEILRP